MDIQKKAEVIAKKIGGYDPDFYLSTSPNKRALEDRLKEDSGYIKNELINERKDALERFSRVFCRCCDCCIGNECDKPCKAFRNYSAAIMGTEIQYGG